MAENQELIKAITNKLKKYYEEYKKEYNTQHNEQTDKTLKDYIEEIDKTYYLNSIKKKVIAVIENYQDVNKYYEKFDIYNRTQFYHYRLENKYYETQKGKTY
jgi:hypothetical protein